MDVHQKVLFVDARTGFYKVKRYPLGDYFGPVDLGIHLADHFDSLNIGVGLGAGSILPGSNRMIFTGISPCWDGFYISSMGGAGLVFNNLGLNMVSLVRRADTPSILYLNRNHGEEIEVEIEPVDLKRVWKKGRGGIYSLMDYAYERFGERYENDPRVLAVGPAAAVTDFGGICSVPITRGKLTYVDTWAGRGGLGSKMLREHGIAAVIYGGTHLEDDFKDRKVADKWFQDKYNMKLAAKDFQATTKYRFNPDVDTGGTFGVNFATMKGKIIAFNYRSIYMTEEERLDIHQKFIVNHYLKQFNEETIKTKQQKTCGEPCPAVCKKMRDQYKKDYEPYQAMGPLTGIFDQRAAEKLNHHTDSYGFDAISAGGVLAWLMDCLDGGLLTPEELGVSGKPVFSADGFDVVKDSMHNAELGVELLDSIIEKRGVLDLENGARSLARKLSRKKGREIIDRFVYDASGRRGWMVPNQYWTPGVLSPMAIMGKYYMYYGGDFMPPRELGRADAEHLQEELIMDNMGVCRMHRAWAVEMIPEILGKAIKGTKEKYLNRIKIAARRINSRNNSGFWETERDIDFVHTFLKRKRDVEGVNDPELDRWIDYFDKDGKEAALEFWSEMYKGINEVLREF
ncbi:MAG: aldehyde ferredoxin oxidoreductase C-terminal domain-containing protein [Candidatus Tritonobacter lacicola]|nr:aldehyde ferredoxin oxidoreductase C-terminal domain-containing protein [Candidatus Tritonobacter lacicola]